MTGEDEAVAAGFEAPPAGAEMDPPPAGAMFPCPECGAEFASKLRLGNHRWGKHGIRGSSSKSKSKRKSTAKTTSAAPGNTGGRVAGRAAMLKEARSALAEAMTMSGEMMVFVVPIPGTYCVQTADEFADAVMRIAAKNDKVLKWLVSGGTMIDYAALGSWTIGLGVALAVQTNRIAPDAPIAQRRGITAIFDEFYQRIPAGEPGTGIIDEGVNDDADARRADREPVDGGLGPAGRPGRAIPVPDLLGGRVGASSP